MAKSPVFSALRPDNIKLVDPQLSSLPSFQMHMQAPNASATNGYDVEKKFNSTGRFRSLSAAEEMEECENAEGCGGAGASSAAVKRKIEELYARVEKRDKHQYEFLQAFREVLHSLLPLFVVQPKYIGVLETIVEPERVITFRVPWLDDRGVQRVNRGFRVQYSSTLGPYKGGLRFHPSVNLSVIKFLGFEQIFKNALTGLPMGGGKGGADFDPKGKSDSEIIRFCQSFMISLSLHIGQSVDVPSGDIGVGSREIGYLFGQYKRMTRCFDGTLTGKDPKWGGSYIRPEATGYGAVYFVNEVLKDKGSSLEGRVCVVSGSGNVAQYCSEKLIQLKAKVMTMSDSDGYIFEPEGFTLEQLQQIMDIKNVQRDRIYAYCKVSTTAKFFPNRRPWEVPCSLAFPCATQNEIDAEDAELLASNGCGFVVEGANMPSTIEAIDVMKKRGIIFCPGKAANAGGVTVSGLEMSQNALGLSWTKEEVDVKLQEIMQRIYLLCKNTALKYVGDERDLQSGSNIASFLKVADSVIEQGCV